MTAAMNNEAVRGWITTDRRRGVHINAGTLSDLTAEVLALRAKDEAAQKQIAVLRDALDKARDPGRDPDYCYDDEWEYTSRFDEWRDLVDGHDRSLPVAVYTLFKGPVKWVANIPNSVDEDGIADGWDTEMFDSEAEADAALAAYALTQPSQPKETTP